MTSFEIEVYEVPLRLTLIFEADKFLDNRRADGQTDGQTEEASLSQKLKLK